MLVLEMSSICVNNVSESLIDISPATYGWISPRISLSYDFAKNEEEYSKDDSAKIQPKSSSNAEPDLEDFINFEFHLEDPATMLPADELFSDGKLVPSHIANVRHSAAVTSENELGSLECSSKLPHCCGKLEISSTDPYLFSPKAPTCSSIRWKELIGLKKLYQKQNDDHKTTTSSSSSSSASRRVMYFLHRSSKSSSLNASSSLSPSSTTTDSSLNLPLLNNDESSVPVPSRYSLSSSSSSGREHDDHPRLSLDSSDKPTTSKNNNLSKIRVSTKNKKPSSSSSENQPKASNRVARSPTRRDSAAEYTNTALAAESEPYLDSPRMNASGKIVFHSLERSSSSPSTLNGGGVRHKYRGMERSYSANVRITPVLNVPVCSLRGSTKFGFPLFSSQQKRETNGIRVGAKRSTQHFNNGRNCIDRT